MRIVACIVVLLAGLAAGCAGVQRGAAPGPLAGDALEVDKSARVMRLLWQGEAVKTYRVALGANPVGHKQRQGDERTPEGLYYIEDRNPDSRFYKAMRISYPNAEDRRRAAALGVDPGGDIMLHGTGALPVSGHRRDDSWTDGCIAVTNGEMDELWAALPDGRPIPIRIMP